MSRDEGPATVLVVEDTLVNRLALAKGVEREGHRVLQADNGRAALEVLASDNVDMVLLDLLMPEVDGFEVLATMARDPATRDIPVLVISAVEKTEDIARAIEMGAIDCLPKPFDPVILSVRLRTALEQARLRKVEQDYLRQELAMRQQERLATLGRLSAGLGHELNNPAAAALSSARRLGGSLATAYEVLVRLAERPDTARLFSAFDPVTPADPPPRSAAEHADEVAATAALLQRHGVSDHWSRAEDLVAAGVAADQAEAVLSNIGDGADIALAWFSVRTLLESSARQVTDSVSRIAELTAALRGYAYLDQAPQQDVDIHAGLDDTLTILQHKVPPGVTVVRDYADDLPAVTAYGGQLNQVWTNLLDNAIAAVGESGLITVRSRRTDGGIVVQVADDGPGIPDELQGRVFDPFVTTKPPGEGTGLGLNISHQIITDAHGGRLTVRSRPGDTVFAAELPMRPPDRSADDG